MRGGAAAFAATGLAVMRAVVPLQVDTDTLDMLKTLNMANLPGVKVQQVRRGRSLFLSRRQLWSRLLPALRVSSGAPGPCVIPAMLSRSSRPAVVRAAWNQTAASGCRG